MLRVSKSHIKLRFTLETLTHFYLSQSSLICIADCVFWIKNFLVESSCELHSSSIVKLFVLLNTKYMLGVALLKYLSNHLRVTGGDNYELVLCLLWSQDLNQVPSKEEIWVSTVLAFHNENVSLACNLSSYVCVSHTVETLSCILKTMSWEVQS